MGNSTAPPKNENENEARRPPRPTSAKMGGEQAIADVLATHGGGKKSAPGRATLTKANSLKNRSEIGGYIRAWGVEISVNTNGEVEAVHCACQHGHMGIIEQLRKFGVDIHARDDEGVTSLMTASLNGHMEIVEYLLKNGADVNAQSDDGATAFMCAAQNGHVKIVKKLSSRGASVSAHTHSGFTALHFAAVNGEREVVDFLTTDSQCKRAIDINAVDNDLVTPLMCACFCGNVDIVRQLLKNGANPQLANHDGLTPLLYAAAGGHVDVVKVLTQPNNSQTKNNNGSGSDGGSDVSLDLYEHARDIARDMGHHHVVQHLDGLL